MPLEAYRRKRNFESTPEPDGEIVPSSNHLQFVVHRHAATRLHYDLRLEMDGVLKSWAVPKGPSLNPKDRRLAMMTEDHPMSYATFEGSIPKGNYGAGQIEIWDKGTYEPIASNSDKTDDLVMRHELHQESIKIMLHGERLKGEFALVKIKNAEEDNAWLLIKHDDDYALPSYDAELHTDKDSLVTQYLNKKKSKKKKVIGKTNEKAFPDQFVSPMLATHGKDAFDDEDWIFEIKWDGYRAIADLRKGIQLYSRNGRDFISRFPDVAKALGQQEHTMVLDGELVGYDEDGQPSFQSIQQHDRKPVTIVYQVFDLLWLNGHATTQLSLLERKELLSEALIETPFIKYHDHIETQGIAFYEQVKQMNLEGMMAKKKHSTYQLGVRSDDWLKVKYLQFEDAYIMGYTKPQGSRSFFGSLLLGTKTDDGFIYKGNVGTGFNDVLLKELFDRMKILKTDKNLFINKHKASKKETYIEPELIAQIKFTELTNDGHYRHAVFLGLREDLMNQEARIGQELEDGIREKQNIGKSKIVPIRRTLSSVSAIPLGDINVTNPDKVYWSETGITKLDMIEYYQKVAPYLLPHLQGRPQSMNRHPNGIDGKNFFQKDAPDNIDDRVLTAKLYSDSTERYIDYIICNDNATLKYINNLGCIELNPWLSTIYALDHPTYIALDLDPSEGNTFEEIIDVAWEIHGLLQQLDIPDFLKTSGSRGLHIYIPLGENYTYKQGRDFAHLIMQYIQKKLPKITTLERSLSKRPKNAIYLDYLQNRRGQTLASVYSVRPKKGATVSTPLHWHELRHGLLPQDFNIFNVPDRLQVKDDLFAGVLQKEIDMLQAIEKMAEL